ncbi:YHYH domain-containing protein [Methylomonas sp. UP202]|uniref:YHYH domain-containing protein n=1 Tax=Methylomonas sp. UP202 TaxID=3040943 RepID=UPI00247A5EFF|nr:YHYH domain-containing protein [Methylomonas sp. UP202]WGS85021.1 YHYH domain-containing protein [Methylomonas sp. UP202]
MTKSTPSFFRLGYICLALLCPIPAYAHPGKLNAEGCHTERKTGDYHYPGPRPVSSTLSLT